MNNTKKMYLVPYQHGGGGDDEQGNVFAETTTKITEPQPAPKKGNSIRQYAAQRQTKLLQIVLKLAEYGGYDSDGMIKSASGEMLDIVPLLLHVASPGRSVKGLGDFVDLLHKAGVAPELVINASVREELAKRRKGRSIGIQTKTPPPELQQTPMDEETAGTKRKRTTDESDASNVPLPKGRKEWDSTDSDEDEK